MKIKLLINSVITFLICTACEQTQFLLPMDELSFTGNKCQFTQSYTTASSQDFLPENSEIIINAEGGTTISNLPFTLQGGKWITSEPVEWQQPEKTLFYTAIHPAMQSYDATCLYEGGRLKDILYTKGNATQGTPICFTFAHLFSQITFHVDPQLRNELQKIALTTSKQVKELQISANDIIPVYEIKENTCEILCNGALTYSFLIPATDNLSLSLRINHADKVSTHIIEQKNFQSNYAYSCTIKKTEDNIGIHSAKELIEFAKLYNTNSPALKKYATIENGRTVYKLLNDITFTEEEKGQFMTICPSISNPFRDTFDGQGFTISNFSESMFPNNKHKSLFSYTGKTSCIKNLCFDSVIISKATNLLVVGVLAQANSGDIINCKFSNINIDGGYDNGVGNIGIISVTNGASGKIINCQVTSSKIKGVGNKGGICVVNSGEILNSFTSDIYIERDKTSSAFAGICAEGRKNSLIANCYTDCQTNNAIQGNYFTSLLGKNGGSKIQNCFYRYRKYYTSTGYGDPNDTGIKEHVLSYEVVSNDLIGYVDKNIRVIDELNNWINLHASDYPLYTFKYWTNTTDSKIPAIFVE